MMSFFERFIEQDRQEGRQAGKPEGKAVILLRRLRLKFGGVPEPVRRKIEQVTGE